MYVPVLLDKVRMKDRGGVFLVARVDEAGELVDLVPWGYGNERLENISFTAVEPLEEK
jgi:hypothetical protein